MRRIKEEDLEMVMEWRMRPNITEFMNTDPTRTIKSQKEWFNKIKDNKEQIYWIIVVNNVPIGVINVFNIDYDNKRCSWGYYIAEVEYRSLKLALFLEWNLYDYVFDTLMRHKFCNETFVDNKQVIKLHGMCGSKEDGIMRQHIYKNGKYYDVSVGSILVDEWRKKKNTVKYENFMFE